jgi:acyl-CoA synthetase (AMP-forming)/AMP-acid ligase II
VPLGGHIVRRRLCRAPRVEPDALFHIHGFVASLLATLAAGGSVACCPGYRDRRFLPWLDELRPTWYTAAPAVHQAVLAELARHAEGIAANRLRFVRSASAPMPESVLRALESAFQAPVIEAYGMTEAAHRSRAIRCAGERRPNRLIAGGTFRRIMDVRSDGGSASVRFGRSSSAWQESPRQPPPEATPKPVDGWLRTGDLGVSRRDAYIFHHRSAEGADQPCRGDIARGTDDMLLEHADWRGGGLRRAKPHDGRISRRRSS